MNENSKDDAFMPQDSHDSSLASNEEIISKLDASGVSLSTPEGAHREDSMGMPWLPTTMVVDSSHDSSQTFVLDDANDSGHGIYVQIPYQMVSDQSNQGHLHGSIVSQPEDIASDDHRNGEMKLMVKFGDTVCPLSMFGLDASSFVGKISQAGEEDESDQMYHHQTTSALAVSDESLVDDEDKGTCGYCSLCGKFIKDSVEMEKHLIYHQEHTNAMSVPSGSGVACIDLSVAHKSCPACGSQLRHHESFSQRDFHNEFRTIEQLTNIPMFTCDECGKDYALGISQDIGTFDSSDAIPSQSSNSSQASFTVHSNSNYDYNSSDMSYSRDSSSISNRSGVNPSTSRFSCSECGKSYKHNRDLRKHVRTRHAGSEADMYLNTKPIRNYNNQQKNSFAPSKMREASVSEQFMHMDATLGTSRACVLPSAAPTVAKLMCDLCKKYFRGPFELRRHIKTVHENNRPFKCQSCDKSFRDAHELRRHNAGHQRPPFPYSTHHSMLQGSSQDSSAYSDSKGIHIKRESLIGENASPGSFTRSQHVVYSHSSDTSIDQNNSNDMYQQGSYAISDGGIYNSDRSSMIVPTLPSLEHHHLSNSIPSATMVKSHSMNIGSIANDYFCSACEKNFRGANEFKRHYSVVHEKKYRYKCIHCGKLWRDQYDLKRHCKRSHFLDQEIDKSFIKQCLLANGSLASIQSVSSQHSNALPCMTAPGMDLINSNVTDGYTHVTSAHPIIVDSRRQSHHESVILRERVDSISHADNSGMTLVNRNDIESYISSASVPVTHRTHIDVPESSHCSSASINNVRNSGNILFTCDFSPHQVMTKSAPSTINLDNSNQPNISRSTVSPVHPSWTDLISGT